MPKVKSKHSIKLEKVILVDKPVMIDKATAYLVESSGQVAFHVKELLKSIEGSNYKRDGLNKTPDRVERMYAEVFAGYNKNPKDIFTAVFKSDNDSMVIVKDIDFYSHCEHHMIPFFGKVHIAYIPNGKVLGLSKFARLVEVFARRLQIQEQMTFQIKKLWLLLL